MDLTENSQKPDNNFMIRNSFDTLYDFSKESIFLQIQEWISKDSHKIDDYTDDIFLSERKDDEQLLIYKKKSTGKYVVLKTFMIENNWNKVVSFIYDTIIPVLINEEWMMKYSDIFMDKKVISLYNIKDIYFYD